ncbi:hypothetical protein [Azospirillum griseum]|uniref:Uncharacterized protein n=1 Tax=Azospirillum griseum TaxID=2496639 RepID=A0A431VK60_9PROT|nr:hypothetical protein [Azospirillum griseum]RTR22520.1 hypothetical protein EJ903_06805 [Azospirillum griseum]
MNRIRHVLAACALFPVLTGPVMAQTATGPCGQFKITNEISGSGKKTIGVDVLFGNQWLKTKPIAMKFGEQMQTAVQFPDSANCTSAYVVNINGAEYKNGITNFCTLIRFRVLPTGVETMHDASGAVCPGG